MRAFFVSDLHVDVPGNESFVRDLARLAHDEAPDVVIVAGDVCNGIDRLEETLGWFRVPGATALYVPGNHELWSLDAGASARTRYYREIPPLARNAGFTTLMTEPAIIGDVAFAGTMGWYDYSFVEPADGYSADELASKTRDGMRWMDSRFVRWADTADVELSDPSVSALLCDDLADQFALLQEQPLRRVVMVTHHLPAADLLPPVFRRGGRLQFFRAFLGSERLLELATSEPRLDLALAGHVHAVRTARVGSVELGTCPSGYPRERAESVTPPDRRLLLEL